MAKGDIAIYRTTLQEAVVDDPSFLVPEWDDIRLEQGDYSLNSTGQLVVIKAGYHLVSYNVSLDSTTPTLNVRTECQLGINLGSIVSPTFEEYGRSTGFVRHKQVDEIPQAYPSGTTLINAPSNTILSVVMNNTDSGTGAVKIHTNNSLQLLNLGTSVDCLRVREVAGGQAFPNNTFVQMTWDTSDEADAAFFTYNASGSFTIKTTGRYLVMANVGFHSSGTGANDRSGSEFELRLNGGVIPGARSMAYMRGTGGCQDYVANCSAIVRTFTANSTLSVWCRENSVPVKGFITAKAAASSIVVIALPSTAKTFTVVDNDGTQDVDTIEPLDFASTSYMDADAYSKDASWRVSYKKTSKYFHFYNFFVERGDTVPVVRHYPFLKFIRDWYSEDDTVSIEDRGAGGGFLRGYVSVQPPGSPFTSGSGGFLDYMAVKKYPHGLQKNDASDGTEATSVYVANKSRWDCIDINNWLGLNTEVGRCLVPDGDSTAIAMLWGSFKSPDRYAMINSKAAFPDRTPITTNYIGRFGVQDTIGRFSLSPPPNILPASDTVDGIIVRWWYKADSTTSSLFLVRFLFYDKDGTTIIAQTPYIDIVDTATVLQASAAIYTSLTVQQLRDMEMEIQHISIGPDITTLYRIYDVRIEYQTREFFGNEKAIASVTGLEKTIGAIAGGTTEKTVGAIAGGTTEKTIGAVAGGTTEKTIASVTSTEKEIDL